MAGSSNDDYPLDNDPAYLMTHSQRGVAVIINNEEFEPKLELSKRTGSSKDEEALQKTFNFLGFKEIITEKNLTAKKMSDLLTAVANRTELQHMDGIVIAMLSHGDSDGIFGKDEHMPFSEIFAPFRNSISLAGKPKVFVIQACRGKDIDNGYPVSIDGPVPSDYNKNKSFHIPKGSDMLTAYATIEGHVSLRNHEEGSWFIQTFCQVMDRHGREREIHQLLTKVNHIVSHKYKEGDMKQSPCFTSSLTKSLTFT